MTPVKITFIGDFWDCQIYRGRLYIWYTNGLLKVLNWHQVVDFFIKKEEDRLAFTCAFLQGRFLYGEDFSILFKDPEFKIMLEKKFNRILRRELIIDEGLINQFVICDQENPFKELQTDSEILNNKIYAATYKGMYYSTTHRPISNKYAVSIKPKLINDFVAYSIKAGKYAKIALSGGSEGLYEYNAASNNWFDSYMNEQSEKRIRRISNRHSTFADYNFLSLYNTSLLGESFLTIQKWHETKNHSIKKAELVVEEEVSQYTIFGRNGHNSLSWGTNEKLYYANDNSLEVVNFNNYNREKEYFSERKNYNFQAWKGRILKGGTAYFGTIVECENALVVVADNDEFYNIPGDITRWRVYPRSINYENHLHVIHQDRLEIYSFNNDYFRNQSEKEFGIRFSQDKMPKISNDFFNSARF